MASNINPNNIDTTYPIAGQDNDSQGFRDNFTNIKSNFTEAQSEIDDLQSKVVLKSALTGTTLDNDFNGAVVSSAKLQDTRETVISLSETSGTITLDHSAGHYYKTPTTSQGSYTVAFSNLPPSGSKGRIQLQVTISSTAHSLTLPPAVGNGDALKSITGIQGISSKVITFNDTGTYIFEFTTTDAGSSIHVEELTRPRNSFQNPIFMASSEDVADAAAMDLTKAVSYFTTGSAETATLAAGADGQIKNLVMVDDGGDMVVTVTNAGWKASGTGTITFDDIGDSCQLIYTNSKWYAVGQNGVTFG